MCYKYSKFYLAVGYSAQYGKAGYMAFNAFMESIGTNWSVGAPDGLWWHNVEQNVPVVGGMNNGNSRSGYVAITLYPSVWHLPWNIGDPTRWNVLET